ncbi:undecaprenyl-phosphate glucose phosphotransferase [Lutimonas zeaxanthinifaciens]|uniref:undecaprenyl-phosphate glucose phosphotransferase n=1 Tax=Lutimonas zeaxanthinifaciens TaxID=3060215 RepID=UPI00265CEC9C|nr:undecaprenyl-phosphate glucose phosphotransferase [Lutimonas sp. YSD2104]WKK66471.1 undecaprenyl-phosphate glucose phosphotransferase [Lutimonas sp. YSD2104]
MPKGKAKYLPIPAIFIDVILLLNAFLTADYLVFGGTFPDPVFYYWLFLGWVALWISIALFYKLFDLPRILYLDKIVSKTMFTVAIFAMVSASLIYLITDYKFSKPFFVTAILLFGTMLVIWHTMLAVMFKAYRKSGRNFRNVAIVGFKQPAEKLINEVLLVPENGFRISGIYTNETLPTGMDQFYKGTEEGLITNSISTGLDELFIALPGERSELINEYMRFADKHMIRAHILPNFSNYLNQNFAMDYVYNVPILQLRKEPLESLSNRMAKRLFDLLFSTLVLVLLGSWLFPLLALLIKAGSKGPVFFKQLRSGRDDQPFYCYKFRTMTVNEDADRKMASKGDARITRIGSFLRKSSLDELPQFINVLLDDMSVVGPRPHMLQHTDEYQESVEKYMVRHYAKPGITGMAQVNGYRGEIRKKEDIENRAKADVWYIENWSVFLDIKIILKTVWQVFFTKEENAF